MLTLAGFFLATVGAHEAGHAAVSLALHLPTRLVLTRHGPGVRVGSDSVRLARWQVVVTAGAGPAANVALAAAAFRLGVPFLVLMNLECAVLNLLPFRSSDGSRMLQPGRALALARARAVTG